MKANISLGIGLLIIVSGLGAIAAPVTTESLLKEMVDLKGLAAYPDPAYSIIQYSSYDHRSTVPGGPEWFANSDGFGKEPVPNFEAVLREPDKDRVGEYLICDVQGPGALVRHWTARISGTIRMYLDGSETPIYDGPADQYFRYPYDAFLEGSGLTHDDLMSTFYQQESAYCPIPFANGCRVVWEGNLNEIHFYHLAVRRYAPGTRVVSFQKNDLKRYETTLREVNMALTEMEHSPEAFLDDPGMKEFDFGLDTGERKTILSETGSGYLYQLGISLEPNSSWDWRQVLLVLRFDDHPTPQVRVPLGDFFGCAPGMTPYTSLPFKVMPRGGMSCRFVMPYRKKMELSFENLSGEAVDIKGFAVLQPESWDDDEFMHFYARWRIDHGITGDPNPAMDLPFLLAQGKGLYVGTASYILNPNNVPSMGGNWWGEGDEKVFIDDTPQPVLFGTGSEDYYNYAWSANHIFTFPYCGQPLVDGPANRGFTVNNRWHILDPLPFEEKIAFYMELFPHERTENMGYARMAYFYGKPGIMDDYMPVTRADVVKQEITAPFIPAARGSSTGCIFFEPEATLATEGAALQPENGQLWSQDSHQRWTPKAIGDELHFTLKIPEAGPYEPSVVLALDNRSGKVSAQIEGTECRMDAHDLYRRYRMMSRRMGMPRVELEKGNVTLILRYEGPGEKEEANTIGIDFFALRKR